MSHGKIIVMNIEYEQNKHTIVATGKTYVVRNKARIKVRNNNLIE